MIEGETRRAHVKGSKFVPQKLDKDGEIAEEAKIQITVELTLDREIASHVAGLLRSGEACEFVLEPLQRTLEV